MTLPALAPTVPVALMAGGIAVVVLAVATLPAVRLRGKGVRVPYTRKVFHFVVFSGAAGVHTLWGLAGTNVYGAVVATAVLLAVARGRGDPLFDVLARETDRPHERLFVVVPLVTTAVGGLAGALLAGRLAAVGYLVAGWGDAVGEPVGARWGRHTYRVPSLAGVPARRSWEGSAAVFVIGWGAATVALAAQRVALPGALAVGVACAAVGAVVEAVSHHGTDNLTVQVAVSATAWLLLGRGI